MSDPNQHRGWNGPPATQFAVPGPMPNGRFFPRQFDAHTRTAGVEDSKAADLLIQGLMDRLPKRNETWTLDERAKWLRTAASIFGLVYKARDGEQREISVMLVSDNSSTSPDAISPGFIR